MVTTVPLLALYAGTLTLVILTGIGARRRGRGVLIASLAGSVFPVTWTVWYVRDEQPWRRRAERTSEAPVS